MVLTGPVTASDELLIDVEGLAAADPRPTLLDVRWSLAGGPGLAQFIAGHLPEAVFVELDGHLCGPAGDGGRHPLPDPGRLQDALRAAGVREDHPVVIYDAGNGMSAARTWWTLRWAGHRQVRVLDGGYTAWVSKGQPISNEPSEPEPGDFTVRPGAMPVLDAAGAAALAAGEGVLLDVREGPRYRGETEPIDPVAGHIPGAVNLPTAGNADDQGKLLPPAQLRERFAAAGVRDGAPVGAYCGSGVTSAHTILALHRAGRTDAALYVGSWSDWITDPNRPVALGA